MIPKPRMSLIAMTILFGLIGSTPDSLGQQSGPPDEVTEAAGICTQVASGSLERSALWNNTTALAMATTRLLFDIAPNEEILNATNNRERNLLGCSDLKTLLQREETTQLLGDPYQSLSENEQLNVVDQVIAMTIAGIKRYPPGSFSMPVGHEIEFSEFPGDQDPVLIRFPLWEEGIAQPGDLTSDMLFASDSLVSRINPSVIKGVLYALSPGLVGCKRQVEWSQPTERLGVSYSLFFEAVDLFVNKTDPTGSIRENLRGQTDGPLPPNLLRTEGDVNLIESVLKQYATFGSPSFPVSSEQLHYRTVAEDLFRIALASRLSIEPSSHIQETQEIVGPYFQSLSFASQDASDLPDWQTLFDAWTALHVRANQSAPSLRTTENAARREMLTAHFNELTSEETINSKTLSQLVAYQSTLDELQPMSAIEQLSETVQEHNWEPSFVGSQIAAIEVEPNFLSVPPAFPHENDARFLLLVLENLPGDQPELREIRTRALLYLSAYVLAASKTGNLELAKDILDGLTDCMLDRSETQLLLLHVSWSPELWNISSWIDGGLLAEWDKDSYHHDHVALISVLLNALANRNSQYDGIGVRETNGRQVLNAATGSAMAEAKRVLEERDNISIEPNILEFYRSGIRALFEGKIMVVPADGIAAPGINDHDAGRKFTITEFFFPGQSVPDGNPLQQLLDSCSEFWRPEDLASPSQEATAVFETISSGRYGLLKKTGRGREICPDAANCSFYQLPNLTDEGILSTIRPFPSLGKQAVTNLDVEGSLIYSKPIADIAMLLSAKAHLDLGRRNHRSGGFVFEFDIKRAFVGNDGAANDRLEAFQQARLHLLASTGLLASFFSNSTGDHFGDAQADQLEASQLNSSDDSVLSQAVDTILRTARVQLNRVDAGQDAFGYSGPPQLVATGNTLFDDLDRYARILDGQIDATHLDLGLDKRIELAGLVLDGADEDVQASAAQLAIAEIELKKARVATEVAQSEVLIAATREIAAHFSIESARLQAVAAAEAANASLLRQTRADWEHYQQKAQIQMAMTYMPSYVLELRCARAVLDKADKDINCYVDELKRLNKEYLKTRGKNVGETIKGAAITIIDAVCTAYSLPPIGSIMNSVYDGASALEKGNSALALSSLRRAASAAGIENAIQEELDAEWQVLLKKERWIGELVEGEWARTILDSDTENFITEISETSGLDQWKKNKALTLASNFAKNNLPDDFVSAMLTNLYLATDSDIDEDKIRRFLIGSAFKEFQKATKSLTDNAIRPSIEGLGDEEFSSFLENRLNITNQTVKNNIDSLKEEILRDAAGRTQKVLNSVYPPASATPGENSDPCSAAQHTLSDSVRPPGTPGQVVYDPELELVLGKFSAATTPNQLQSAWESLQDYGTNLGDQARQDLDREIRRINVDLIWNGLPPQSASAFSDVAQQLINGSYSTSMVTSYNEVSQNCAQQLGKTLKQAIVGIETSIDIAVVGQTSAVFDLKGAGARISVSDSWSVELESLLAAGNDRNEQMTRINDEIEDYWNQVRIQFKQTKLTSDEVDNLKSYIQPVSLSVEVEREILALDSALDQAHQAAQRIAISADEITKSVHAMSKQKSIKNAQTELSNMLGAPINAARKAVDDAIETLGEPNSQARQFLEDNQGAFIEKWANELHKRMEDSISRSPGDSPSQIDPSDAKKAAYEAFFIDGAVDEIGCIHAPAPLSVLLGEPSQPALDHWSESETRVTTIMQRDLADNPSGLFLVVRNQYQSLFTSALNLEIARHIQESDTAQSLADAAEAAERSTLRQAKSAARRRAELSSSMADLAVSTFVKVVEREEHRLKAAQYQHQAARTQLDLVQLDDWRQQQSGTLEAVWSPQQIELVQEQIWRAFRDIVFLTKYYGGIDQLEINLMGELRTQFGNGGFGVGIDWKPEWVRFASAHLQKHYFQQSRNRATPPSSKLRTQSFRIKPSTLRKCAMEHPSLDGMLQVVLNVIPVSQSNKKFTNPSPIGVLSGDVEIGNTTWNGPPGCNVEFNESLYSRSVFLGAEAYLYDSGQEYGEADLFLTHQGDGFITWYPPDQERKAVLSLPWPPSGRVPIQATSPTNLERDRALNSVPSSLRAQFDATPSSAYLYPLAGTWTLAISDQWLEIEGDWHIDLYFVHSSIDEAPK